jgi:small-conductance mechanosensitive channel
MVASAKNPAFRYSKRCILATRVCLEDLLKIKALANTAGLSESAFMRQAALTGKIQPPLVIPQINESQWRELARLAANLNQIAARLNSGEAPDAELPALLQEIRRILAEIRAALIGAEGTHGR